MNSKSQTVFILYWGSTFKSKQVVENTATSFEPLIKRGWKCYLLMERAPEDQSWLKELIDSGVEMLYLPRPTGNFDFKCIRAVARLVRTLGVDVFHCYNLHTSPLIGAFLGGAPVRIWSKLAMNPEFEECRPPSLKERIAISLRVTCVLATRVLACSTSVRDELLSKGIPARKFIVRNNAMLPDRVQNTIPRHQVRAECRCSPNDVMALALGHSVHVKGWDVLLNAFAEVAKTVSRARLVFVGSTSGSHERAHHAELLELAKRLNIDDRIHFTGRVPEIKSYLLAADLFVMPSRSEGASVALIEGLQAGLPSIASDVGNAREVIKDGVNGFVVPRCDAAALAKAMIKLMANDELRLRFKEQVQVPSHIPTLEQAAELSARDYEMLLRKEAPPVFMRGDCCGATA